MSAQIERLKTEILPVLFVERSAAIGEYGASDSGHSAMSQLGDLLEGAPVTRLATKIQEIVARLVDADPKKIAASPSWLSRLTGAHVEVHARYQAARRDLEDLIADAEGAAQGVRDAVAVINRLIAEHDRETEFLRDHIQAGKEFLEENPTLGQPDAASMNFDNVRERFARKLANLSTLQASHDMSITQMKLTRAQAIDLLDRYEETARVLVPVWRQHTLALTTNRNMSPAMVAEATKAHEALMKSLAQSMSGITR